MSATVQTLRAQLKEARAGTAKLRELLRLARPYLKFAVENGEGDTIVKVGIRHLIIEVDGTIAREEKTSWER